MRIVFAGGGTGGHLFPGLALAQRLNSLAEVLFLCTPRRFDREQLGRAQVAFQEIDAPRSPGFLTWPCFLYRLLKIRGEAIRLLEGFRPDCVIGLGGYGSAPLLLAARKLRIPYVLLEQNVIPGRVTRLFARGASRIYSQWAEARGRFPLTASFVWSGSPLRSHFRPLEREQARQMLGVRKMLVSVLGGSQGSRRLNDLLPPTLARLNGFSDRVEVIHVTGRDDRCRVQVAYGNPCVRVMDFFWDMPLLYAASDVIVSRAGALAIAEMAYYGKPCLLIPYPHAADDHQRANAEILTRSGAAELLDERKATPTSLAEKVVRLLNDPERRREMSSAMKRFARPDAGRLIIQDLQRIVT